MKNSITVRQNGPLVIQGELRLESASGELIETANELYLCRCGKSNNKPYCDGQHKTTGFADAAEFTDNRSEACADYSPLIITVRECAMLLVKGPVTINNEQGGCVTERNKVALCRCGLSKNKPFCDASHKQNQQTD